MDGLGSAGGIDVGKSTDRDTDGTGASPVPARASQLASAVDERSPVGTAPTERPLDELAVIATTALAAGASAHRAGDLPAASLAFRRGQEAAREFAVRSPDRREGHRLHADALYRLAGVHLDAGDPIAAQAGLDAAEALYSQLGAEGLAGIADARARRARAHADQGHGLSAIVDAQSAVLHHIQTLDPTAPAPAQRGLAGALTCAAEIQAQHGSTWLALTAAQQAGALLAAADDAPAHDGPAHDGPADDDRADDDRAMLIRALLVEIRMLRDLDRPQDLLVPVEALRRIAGPALVGELLAEPPAPPHPGLPAAARHPLVASDTRAAVSQLLDRPLDTVSVPGLLVDPGQLLAAAREGAATALALAPSEPALALAAGQDAACLYACAEELGLVEHPWPQVRVELARWLWLLSELGWLACATGDVALARDLAEHAQHPLVRAESGRHLPTSIAQSVSDSAARLRQLRRVVR
jgi:hypothetical protein